MAVFYLVRHARFDGVGQVLVGRTPGIHLNAAGREQLPALVAWLAGQPIRRVISSPLERTCETAGPLAERLGLPLETSPALLEVAYGDWTGRSFTEIQDDAHWRRYNSFRSGTRIPRGELVLEIQARVVGLMLQLRDEAPETVCALVAHGDVIRAALQYWLGMPLDFVHRLEISPASVSVVRLDQHGPRVLLLHGGPFASDLR